MNLELRYGLIAGAAGCAWSLAEYALGLHTRHLDWWPYSEIASIIVLIIPLHALLRRRANEIPPHFPLPIMSGILRAMAAAFVSGIVGYIYATIYNTWIHPGWMDNVLEWKVARWRAEGIAESTIRSQILSYRWTHGTVGTLASFLIWTPLIGGIIGLILTVWINLRRHRALSSIQTLEA